MSWSVSLTSGQGLVHSLHVPAAPALLHAKRSHRSSYAFLNFKTASVHSKPCLCFQKTAATISKLSISGLCTADLLLTSVKSEQDYQVWKRVVAEFRYKEQKAEGANSSALEVYIRLLALQDVEQIITGHLQVRLSAGLAEGFLCWVPYALYPHRWLSFGYKNHTLCIWLEILAGRPVCLVPLCPICSSGLRKSLGSVCPGGCAGSTGTCKSLASSLTL